jgi:hypothetical protein
MRRLFIALAIVSATLTGCSKTSPFDGIWTFSIEKTEQINKAQIEASPAMKFSLEVIGSMLKQLEIKNDKFVFGAADKQAICTINADKKISNVTCIEASGQKTTTESESPTLSVVDGNLHFSLPDKNGPMTFVFAKATTLASASSVATDKEAISSEPVNSQIASVKKDVNDTCSQGTKTIFSCLSTKGKRIEVCDTGPNLTYSFGLPEKTEINLSVEKSTTTTSQWEGMGFIMSYSINITNGKTTYSVFQEANQRTQEASAGVNVLSGEKILATVNCGDAYFSEIEGIDLPKAK